MVSLSPPDGLPRVNSWRIGAVLGVEKREDGGDDGPQNVVCLLGRVRELETQVEQQRREKALVEKQLKDTIARSQADIAALSRQLDAERAEKFELEKELSQQLVGDEPAFQKAIHSAVALQEDRYQQLREEYEEMMEQAQCEFDELNQQLLDAQQHSMQLVKQLEICDRARESLAKEKKALEASLMETSGDRMDLERERKELEKELRHTRESSRADSLILAETRACDGGALMQELVKTKLELAQLSEKHVVTRRDLFKAKEANLKLASKMTKFEALFYSQRARK